MRILIIGGTGTISHYVTEKYRDMGHSVTVINRGNRKYLNTEHVEYITGNANHRESLLEKVKERIFDKVIDFTTFDKETMKMKIEILSDRCGHYVFISSVAVYESSTDAECYIEHMPIGNSKWVYGWKKSECEKLLHDIHDKDFNYTIIRPALTCGEMFIPYSPIDTYNMRGYLPHCILTGKEILTANTGNDKMQVMHAADMAENIYNLLGTDECMNECFNLSGDEYITSNQVLEKLTDRLGRNAVVCYVPQDEIAQNTGIPPVIEGGWHNRFSNRKVKGILGSSYLTSRSVLESLDESVDFIVKHPEFAGWPKAREDSIQSIIKSAKLKGKANIKCVIHHGTPRGIGHGNDAWKGREALGVFEYCNRKNEAQPFYPWGFRLLDKWLQIKIKGYSLETYFEENEISRIAIYGMGAIGRRLYEEMLQGQIKVCYGIDRNAANIKVDGLEMKTLDDELPDVEAVVVTPAAFYEIEKDIYQKMGGNVNIIFIEDIVDYCLNLV